MTIGVSNFSAERLKEARLARGLFMKSLGDMVGLTGAAIGRYESGQDKPQADKLDLLASKLAFPIDFFVRKPWPEEMRLVFWRSRSSQTKSTREMTEQRMKWLCEVFSYFEGEVNFAPLNLPNVSVPNDFRLITPNLIEIAAAEVRKEWGIRSLPIPDMILALENIGIPVANLEIATDKQDGFCFRSELLNRSFVGINTYNVSACRARFDAAHELGHLILHKFVTAEQERDPASKKIIEDQAHRFAGALLFPRDAFMSLVGIVSLDHLCALKKEWGISIAAMIMRALNLEMIDADYASELFQSMSRRRWRGPLREPYDDLLDMPLERPRMLRRALDVVSESGMFWQSALRSAVPIPQSEMEQLLSVSSGYLDRREIVQFTPQKKLNEKLEAVDLESGNVLAFRSNKNK